MKDGRKWGNKQRTANKGLAIAGGTSKVHVLYFGRNLYFS